MRFVLKSFTIATIILLLVRCNRKNEVVTPGLPVEKSFFKAEKDGREISFSNIRAQLIQLSPTNSTLDIIATSDSLGMVRLRLKFMGEGTYNIGSQEGNFGTFTDRDGSINAQSGSIFIHTYSNYKISGVFNFQGTSVFNNLPVAVNKGIFESLPIQSN